MSAERLREAAALMRERAEAASTGPWKRFGMAGVAGKEWEIVDERRVECDCGEPVALLGCATNQDAVHIASWHPAVALAVAMLLDNEANLIDSVTEYAGLHQPLNTARVGLLLDIADAYLGTPDRSRPGLGTAGVTGAQPDEPASQAGRPVAGGGS